VGEAEATQLSRVTEAETTPVVSGGGGKNYPVVPDDGCKNYPVVVGVKAGANHQLRRLILLLLVVLLLVVRVVLHRWQTRNVPGALRHLDYHASNSNFPCSRTECVLCWNVVWEDLCF